MVKPKVKAGAKFVTYQWLLTTILASGCTILTLVGAIANLTFYSKPAGAAVEARIEGIEIQINDLKAIAKETQQDVKALIARKR